MTHTIDFDTASLGPAFPPFSAGVDVTPGDLTADDPYVVRAVGMHGEIIAELASIDPTDGTPRAWPGDIVETLNAYETFDVSFPKHAFTKDQVALLGHAGTAIELQIVQAGKVLAWGPAVGESGGSNPETVTLQCSGPGWYYAKRQIDEEPVNLLSYGGFEHGDFQGWRTSGSWATDNIGNAGAILQEIETDNVFQGTYAARLTSVGAPTGLALVSNPVLFTSSAHGNRLALTFTVCLENFIGPALFNAGVVLLAGPPSGSGLGQIPAGGINTKRAAAYYITDDTPAHVENRVELEIKIPANKTWCVQVLVFAPVGVTVYDHFFLAPHKRLDTADYSGSPSVGIDVSRVSRMIFEHTLSDIHHHGKSDLNIALDTPDTGVRQSRVYEFPDHIPVDQAIQEFLDRDDCFEAAMAYTATTRTYRLFPITAGGQGTDRTADVTLSYGAAPFASYTTSLDGGSAATKVTALGAGDGVLREEGWATDDTEIGGTTLQATITTPEGTPFNSLEPMARSAVFLRHVAAEVIEVLIVREPGGHTDPTVILYDLLELGDRLNLDIVDGWHTYDGVWRIVRKARHCGPRTMTLTLNKVAA